MNARTLLYLTLFTLGQGALAWGDVVVSTGGDSFTGTVQRITNGVLVFRTELSGQMMMPMDTVGSLATDRSMAISLQDGTVLYGTFGGNAGAPVVVPPQAGEPVPVTLGSVKEALPVPKAAGAEDPDAASRPLEAQVELGLRMRSGSRDALSPEARLDLNRAGERLDLDSTFRLEGSGGDFPQAAEGSMEIRANRPEGFAPYGAVDLERNLYEGIDLRAQLSLGLQRELLSTPAASLRGYIGVGYAYEDWDIDYLRRTEGQRYGDGDSDRSIDALNLPLGLRYSRALFENARLESGVSLYPSLSDPGELRARSRSAVSYPMTDRLHLRLNLDLDYNSNPAYPGLDSFSTSVGAGIGVNF